MARVGLIWDVRVSDAQIDELIEVALQVALSEAMRFALCPLLQVGKTRCTQYKISCALLPDQKG